MTFSELLSVFGSLLNCFLNALNQGLKLFFNDLPILFGLRLGWWFVLFGILSLFSNYVRGGAE